MLDFKMFLVNQRKIPILTSLFFIALLNVNPAMSSESYMSMEDLLEKETLEAFANKLDFPIGQYDLVENLLLSSMQDAAVPDPVACTDLDPEKYFDVMNIEKKVLRICDLCPNFPFQKLLDVNFNGGPLLIKNGSNYQHCLADCLSEVSCVAVSFGSGRCNFYDHTDSNLVKVSGQILIIVTQPTGIIRDWVYGRNTAAKFGPNVNVSEAGYFQDGPQIVRSKEENFIGCLSKCDVSPYCTSASYNILERGCDLLINIEESEPEVVVDYKYGHLAALKINKFSSAKNNSWWRFQSPLGNDGKLTELFKRLFVYETNATAPEVKTEFGTIPSLACAVSTTSFCTSNQTIGCRNPENSGDKEAHLPICPGSRHEKYSEIKARMDSLQRCFETCLDDRICVGVAYSANITKCEILTINDPSVFSPPDIFFPLRMPSLRLNTTALKFSIYPGFAFNESGIVNIQTPNASSCLDLCQRNLRCDRFSYDASSKQCNLAEKLVPLAANPNGLVFIQVPEILSAKIAFTRLVSSEFLGREALSYVKSPGKLSREMMEYQIDGCLVKCLEYPEKRCQFVGVEYDFNQGHLVCILFQHGLFSPLDGASTSKEVYIRNSDGDLNKSFSQENLNQLPLFGVKDFTGCFRPKPVLSLQQLLGSSSKTSSPPEVDQNIKIRFAYPRTPYARAIPTELSDLQKRLKSTIFDKAGLSLIDVADEMAPMSKINNTIDRMPVVVKIWQSMNFENIFQEVKILPFDRKHSPFRIGRDLVKSGTYFELSSFGTSQSGLVNDFTTRNKNFTEVSSIAALTIYGQSEYLKEFEANVRIQFGSLEKLIKYDSGVFDTTESNKRPKVDYNCYHHDCCLRGHDITDLERYMEAVRVGSGRITKEPCSKHNCYEQNNVHAITVSGRISPINQWDDIRGQVAYYAGNFSRPESGKSYSQFMTHVVDQFNFGATDKEEWSSSFKWVPYDCTTNVQDKPSLLNYQYGQGEYKGLRGKNQKNKLPIEKWYDRGHFVPAATISRLGQKATASTYYYVNTAPQAHIINNGCWKSLEHAIGKTMGENSGAAIVATGSCPEAKPLKDLVITAPVPKCFWKLVCYKIGFDVFVSGYMHNNWYDDIKEDKSTHLKPLTQEDLIKEVFKGEVVNTKIRDIWKTVTPILRNGRQQNLPQWNDCVASTDFGNHIFADKQNQCTFRLSTGSNLPLDQEDNGEFREELARVASFESTQLENTYEYYSDSIEDSVSDPTPQDSSYNWHFNTDYGDGFFNSTTCNKRLVGYFNGANPEYAFTFVTGLALTHAIYLTLPIKEDGSINDHQLKAGSNTKAFAEFLYKVKVFEHVNSMVSIGDYSEDTSRKFSSLAADPVKRLRFLQSVVQIINVFNMHGVDLNWQQFYLPGSQNKDRENFVTLVREMRQIFDEVEKLDVYNRTLSISIVGSNNLTEIDSGLDLPQLLKYVDWVNVNLTGLNGEMLPLYPLNSTAENPRRSNSQWVLRYYTCKAKEFGSFKINMAVPFQEEPNQESLKTLKARADYAVEMNLGGFSIWSIDKLKKKNYTELELIRETNLCNKVENGMSYKCYDSEVIRWAPIGKEAPKCGDQAPLVNGHLAVCSPYDPDFGCCGANGLCGFGAIFCTCPNCVDYYNHPEKI